MSYLETDFEKDLFDAAIQNLDETENKLRLNNFAYAVRDLTRLFLDRLAPDDEVRKVPWYEVYDSKKPKMVTREQKIKYAIQGYLSDDFTKNELQIDLSSVSANLIKNINDLSKYTHVNPETFDASADIINQLSSNVMEDTLGFFTTIDETQNQVMNALDACITVEMVSQFYYNTFDEIDMLATHHEVLGYVVTELTPLSKADETITMQADGFVIVRLQYGSDGDLRRGDGYETKENLPFTSSFVASYKNQEGDVHLVFAEIEVDNYSFFE